MVGIVWVHKQYTCSQLYFYLLNWRRSKFNQQTVKYSLLLKIRRLDTCKYINIFKKKSFKYLRVYLWDAGFSITTKLSYHRPAIFKSKKKVKNTVISKKLTRPKSNTKTYVKKFQNVCNKRAQSKTIKDLLIKKIL